MTSLLALILLWLAVAIDPRGPGTVQTVETQGGEVAALNAAFLKHLSTYENSDALTVRAIRDGWEKRYRADDPESFVPDALARLVPACRAALESFDRGQLDAAGDQFQALVGNADPFVAANAAYWLARTRAAQGLFEEAQAALEHPRAAPDKLRGHTPYAPHAAFLLAACRARNLNFDEAGRELEAVEHDYPEAPEMVRLAARQLLIELGRREPGSLDEAAGVMNYIADRLAAQDVTERVQSRQDEVVALLDKLIEQMQQQEQQGQGGGSGGGPSQQQGGPGQAAGPMTPRQQSDAPEGAGEVGELRRAATADPGEMWGKLPPAERERILQNIRARFPSRYRQLVEQYYRSLAEERSP